MFNQTSALPGTVMSITHLSPHEIFLRPPSDGQQHTVVKELVQEHTASRWSSWDLNPGHLAPALCSEDLCSPHSHFSRMSYTFIQWRGLNLGSRGHALPVGPGWGYSAGFSAGIRKRAEPCPGSGAGVLLRL